MAFFTLPRNLVLRLSQGISHRRWLSSTAINSSRFIPLSTKTLFTKLMNEKEDHKENSLELFEKFVSRINHAVTKENISLLPELKILYDPINPDADTKTIQMFRGREQLDREFWFLQKCSTTLAKSGFQELDEHYLRDSLHLRPVGQGVIANIEPDRFEVLRCWVLSDLEVEPSVNPLKPLLQDLGFIFEQKKSKKIFKRVVMASRQKGKDKLSIKLFKEIPSNQLHLLLPPLGGLKMHDSYCQLLYITSGLSTFFLLSRSVVTWLVGSNHHLGYIPIGFSAFFGMVAVVLWGNFKQRQKRHLCDVIEVLSNRFVASNQNLLAVISDKVQDEMLKGILITYFFLTPQKEMLTDVPRISADDLTLNINAWVESQTGQKIEFDVHPSLAWLSKMGLIEIDSNTQEIMPLPISKAMNILPKSGQDFLLPVRVEEFDLFYGDITRASDLDKQDFMDKFTFSLWQQLNKFKNRF